MSKLRHSMQPLHDGALSARQIGVALGISKSTLSEMASYARAAGLKALQPMPPWQAGIAETAFYVRYFGQ